MTTEQASVDSESIRQAKQQISSLVREIQELCLSDLGPDEFYIEFLQRVIQALGAYGGAVWTPVGDRLQPLYHQNVSPPLLEDDSEDGQRHFRLVDHVYSRGEPQMAPPGAGDEDGKLGNPTNALLVLSPLHGDNRVEGVIEVFQRADADQATQRGYLRFLVQMCALVSQWLKNQKLKDFSQSQSLWGQRDRFVSVIHESLNARLTAYTIANEARPLLGCDRVSVATRYGRKCRIEAVSGQDVMERRSNIIVLLERLTSKVLATDEPFYYTGSTDDMPPQIEQALHAYIEESFVKTMIIVPLRKPPAEIPTPEQEREATDDDRPPGKLIGALIIEQIEDRAAHERWGTNLEFITDHSARALSNSLTHSQLFLMPVWRLLGRAMGLFRGRLLPKTLAVLGVIAAIMLFLALWRTDFTQEGEGTLQPVKRQELFAPVEAKVINVAVNSGDSVRKGQLLVEMESPDLDIQIEEKQGELGAADKALASVNAELLRSQELKPDDRIRLHYRRAELENTLANLNRQLQILLDKRKGLKIVSPMDGRVVTWDIKKLLSDRPVTPGQVLVTVFDPEGGWELELFIPEKRMGHVNKAYADLESAERLPVSYILESDPEVVRHGFVKEIQPDTQIHEDLGPCGRLRISIDKRDQERPINDPRMGVVVSGHVDCGSCSLGYHWGHEAYEAAQRFLFSLF